MAHGRLKHTLLHWLVLLLLTSLLWEVSWWVVDEESFFLEFWNWKVLAIDMVYCALLTMLLHISLSLRKRNQDLELEMLKRQLDPHFLFNNLSNIAGTLPPNSDAHRILTLMSRIYRYIMTQSSQNLVPITDGVRYLKMYVEILDLRHPGHFKVNIDPRMETSDKMMVPMSLQQLIENAVKHNRHTADAPLEIIFTMGADSITVRNRLRPTAEATGSTKTGLDNLSRRCQLIMKRKIDVQATCDWFVVEIPIQKKK